MKSGGIFIVILFTISIQAQISELKLIPSDPQNVVSFGSSVAIDNNILIVGGPESDIQGVNSGAAVVFEKVNGNWVEDTLLLADDGTTAAHFGWAVGVKDNYVFIGADQDPEIGTWAGAVYIYKRDTLTGLWYEFQKIVPGDIQAWYKFGSSISISGNKILIGARDANSNVGAAYVFRLQDTLWVEEQKLTPSGYVGAEPYIGNSVSIDGDYAIVGAHNDDSGGNESGAAYIFYYDGNEWTQQAKILSSDISSGDKFGFSVSLSGDYVIVGAVSSFHQTHMTGAAYVFQRQDTLWVEEVKLVDSSAVTTIAFGFSVSLLNNYALVGVRHDNQNGNNSGAAYIFKRVNSNWTKLSKILASDGGESDQFGYQVDLDEEIFAVGAPIQYAGGLYCGAAYLYSGFVTSVFEIHPSIVKNFQLSQNYPNPFNPNTRIIFTIPQTGFTSLKVYDVLGNEVATLINEEKSAGEYEIDFNSNGLTSGIYFYQIKAGNFIETKKMVLMK
ncbi:MAG: T9SS type A sorting domain-containing protein [Ignavibacteriaceae bacterium]|nr:T9SS type A sorting domain-containing protein [Ignavibacteriaceae bacterium]